MLRSEHYQRERRTIGGVEVSIESYKIGDSFYCHLSNVEPGATIARTEAPTREEAINKAIAHATEKLAKKS
jgi:hypothetical protein